ncbi:MAG: nucleoside hydrolase, partial [Muribaculaceae bacterium]|nr:nucleoside hydrolase [Muribaculaceae bacterium]
MKNLYIICLAIAAGILMWACDSSTGDTGAASRHKVKNVIIDADTDNEVDDLIAIMAALKADEDDELDIIGMTAVQWDGRNDTLPEGVPSGWNSRSAYSSWLMNIIMAQMLDRPDLPLLKGSDKKIVYKKGYDANQGRPCEAADFIIAKAKELPEGEKLIIISTGALTNVAAALMQD